MKQKQLDQILLGISLGSFLVMSASFLLMPLEGMNQIPGLMFWCGLGLGFVTQISLETRRRAFFKRYNVRRKNMQKPRCGLLSFGSNQVATIIDILLLVSVLATALVFVLTKGYGYICYILIAITIFFLCLHCIFNGRNYFHVNNQNKVRQVLDQKSKIYR